jgi:hypothetical protein
MLVAFEINFALWGMIGCGLAELAQVVGYLRPTLLPEGEPAHHDVGPPRTSRSTAKTRLKEQSAVPQLFRPIRSPGRDFGSGFLARRPKGIMLLRSSASER